MNIVYSGQAQALVVEDGFALKLMNLGNRTETAIEAQDLPHIFAGCSDVRRDDVAELGVAVDLANDSYLANQAIMNLSIVFRCIEGNSVISGYRLSSNEIAQTYVELGRQLMREGVRRQVQSRICLQYIFFAQNQVILDRLGALGSLMANFPQKISGPVTHLVHDVNEVAGSLELMKSARRQAFHTRGREAGLVHEVLSNDQIVPLAIAVTHDREMMVKQGGGNEAFKAKGFRHKVYEAINKAALMRDRRMADQHRDYMVADLFDQFEKELEIQLRRSVLSVTHPEPRPIVRLDQASERQHAIMGGGAMTGMPAGGDDFGRSYGGHRR